MKSYVSEFQKSRYEDPSFFVEHYNVGRGFTKESKNKNEPHIVRTTLIVTWRIVEDELLPVETSGLFWNTEAYLVRWTFECSLQNNELTEETIFFYWKGSRAAKGLSPLPPNFDNETSVVNRIVQWSEPAVFFHIFSNPVVVLDGKCAKLNPNIQHLFIIRGELQEEIHLYEVSFLKKNLRSRGVFLIVDPETKKFFIWKGSKITKELDIIIGKSNLVDTLKSYEHSWKDFEVLEIMEYEENDALEGDSSSYWHVQKECNFSPRLFFLNSITGKFLATEVEYPLRSRHHVAAFPFLQSHLNTSVDQPGLFLLDNNHEIWFVSTGLKPSEDLEELNKLATEAVKNYAEEKEKLLQISVPIKHVTIGSEPIEFTNIFPYWN